MNSPPSTIREIDEHEYDGGDADLTTLADENSKHVGDLADPPVTFYPPLFLQRRIWILDILRRENIVDVLDVGCGEGQLLSVLAQPAPWLAPPPPDVFASLAKSETEYSYTKNDLINNLHPMRIAGLDVSAADLEFAVVGTAPPSTCSSSDTTSGYTYAQALPRWEALAVSLWKGGLEVVNEAFVGVECIVCTEVIEHLPPHILPTLAPMLLGVYHPQRLLLTTPSYTFNARFTHPDAPPASRLGQGYLDATGRTSRVFRHSDHKFEWTVQEFQDWCRGAAEEWGYDVEEVGGVGRALEADPWGRDAELGDASQVVAFRRREDVGDKLREERARKVLEGLGLGAGEPHELLAEHRHTAHPMARKPPARESVREIGDAIKRKMEAFREAFVPLEQIWFEKEVSTLCSGWIEVLIYAVQEYEGLNLVKGGADGLFEKEWTVELVGGVKDPRSFWPEEKSVDWIPRDWIPGEDPEDHSDEEEEGDEPPSTPVSSTGADGDVSWNGSELGEGELTVDEKEDNKNTWGRAGAWGDDLQEWGRCKDAA